MDTSEGTEQAGPARYVQENSPRRRGIVYANQGTGPQIINTTSRESRPRTDTKALIAIFVFDVAYFIFGALTYTGKETAGDMWRAVIFLGLLFATAGMARRWVRRRT